MIEISVIICTYNRSDYLPAAIKSCIRQTMDDKKYEILIIDNNSTDGTEKIVRCFQKEYRNIRYFKEESQGLNFARNRGAAEAEGRYVAYLDDDARAEPDWLTNMIKTFRRQNPQPVCAGGCVRLDWEGPVPDWFPQEFNALMAFVDHGSSGFYLKYGEEGHFLIGTNMAFQRDVLIDMNGFRTAYGRKKRRTISGAETELVNRLLLQGLPVYYSPDAAVTHTVVPERRTRRFLIKRMFGDGATQPLMDLETERFCSTPLIRRILYDMKICIGYYFQYLYRKIIINDPQSLTHYLFFTQRRGRLSMELRFLYDPEFRPLWKNRRQGLRVE